MTILLKPKRSCTRSRTQWWSRVLNDVLMSSDSITEGDLLAVADSKSFNTLVMAVSVECNARYADCRRPQFGEFSMWRHLTVKWGQWYQVNKCKQHSNNTSQSVCLQGQWVQDLLLCEWSLSANNEKYAMQFSFFYFCYLVICKNKWK